MTAPDEFAGHTPGPWEAVPTHPASDEPWWAILHNGRGPIVDVGGKRQIAEAKHLATPAAEVEANARLIAAAPSLLRERDALRANLAKINEAAGLVSNGEAGVGSATLAALADQRKERDALRAQVAEMAGALSGLTTMARVEAIGCRGDGRHVIAKHWDDAADAANAALRAAGVPS